MEDLWRDRLSSRVLCHDVGKREQNPAQVLLGRSVIPEHVGQRLPLQELMLETRMVDEGVLGACGGISPRSLQSQPSQVVDDGVRAGGVDGTVGGADTLQTTLQIDDEV